MKQKGNSKSSINKELNVLEEIDSKIDIVFKNIFEKRKRMVNRRVVIWNIRQSGKV